jgi:hypothetical protein
MLGCANWHGLRLVPRTELFHFIRHSKGLLFRVESLPDLLFLAA